MKFFLVILIFSATVFCLSFSLRQKKEYKSLYESALNEFKQQQNDLRKVIKQADLSNQNDKEKIKEKIKTSRSKLKAIDFWLRYFEPLAYKKINGPLPVEWETEVFEKYEPPYRRQGGGITLAELALEEETVQKDSLLALIDTSVVALQAFEADSITTQLDTYHHFFLANRLYLLNLATIYTTGFECPDTSNIIPELRLMLSSVKKIYEDFDGTFPQTALSKEYLDLYDKFMAFVNNQLPDFSLFDHFSFIKDFVNPLFRLNQQFINSYGVRTISLMDFSLENNAYSIFDKALYSPQNTKGIFSLVDDENVLAEIKKIGKLLFYDPILSGNNKRSCASCHKPTEYFTDTTLVTAFQFDDQQHLSRNTPTLLNSVFNHLVMYDGKHISLQGQAKDVIQNPVEMNSHENELIKKVLSCKEYKDAFKKFAQYTPEEKAISLTHIVSAITYYYADFSNYYSPFDNAMNNKSSLNLAEKNGFNIFMSKAQCGTCHFLPQFNGVKPPYVGSEFEVIGVPEDSSYKKLSPDKGRYAVNPAKEMMNAFRTGTVRNAGYTKPYMHNGVFQTLEQVVDLYDAGGGVGKKLKVDNQTLSTDSLKLTKDEKINLIAFIHSLDENIIFEPPPPALPISSNKELNNRKVGGEY
ncbi:MAG: cytochrome c peroxidase [Chitinophagaceae bacterium]